jgi:putative endonuclease
MTAQEKGRAGEKAAADYLAAKGYETVERNYHSRSGEIDIIAAGRGYIVFAEVKLRKNSAMVSGLEAVDLRKMRKIYKTACQWLSHNPVDLQPRFDVIELTASGDGFDLTHIENAFGAEVCDEIF